MGPSWDVNPAEVAPNQYLFGQMGEGDESESLPVIIAGSKADDILAELAKGNKVVAIQATGTLCHRDHIRNVDDLRTQVLQWGKSFDFCLIVYGDRSEHKAIPVPAAPPRLYSGYMWECVMPKSSATYDDGQTLLSPNLRDVYFLWEHTNLAKAGATGYNLESLLRKKEFVAREVGELITIQKSGPFIEGECVLPRERFYEFLRGAATRRAHPPAK